MTDLPLTQTPADYRALAPEYIRIAREEKGGKGYTVSRCKTLNRTGTIVETLATLCGGNMGKILALVTAQTAAKTGMIDTIYLDADV